MKIAAIDMYAVDLPYSGGTYLLSSARAFTSFTATIVAMTTDTGITGWGESTPFGATYIASHALGVQAGVREMAPVLLGQDPRHVDRIFDLMDQTLVGHTHAKTPIDVACWDILGQATGLPCHALLGGAWKRGLPKISSIHAGDPDDMRARVQHHRAMGYRGHSIKIGATDSEGGPVLDVERITASLADRQPGEYFLVDANGGLTPETGLRLCAALPQGLDIVFEAPCATWAETLAFRARCPFPIVLDELVQSDADVAQLILSDAGDGFGLKISKQGGLTPGRRQRDMARAAGLTISVQETVGSDIAFAAIAHLAATVPDRNLRCILDTRDMVTVQTATPDVTERDGLIFVGDTPGLGLRVDHDVLGTPVESWT